MQFCELTEKEYRAFWENHPLKSFLSAVEIGKLKKLSNWSVSYVGVKKEKKIVAASMLVAKKRHFNRYEFYSPRGYLLDLKDEELLSFFTKELKKYLKDKKAYVFRVDPYLIYKERDIDGNIVENGIDNSSVVRNLTKLGFKKVPLNETEQVTWMFSLDLENKNENDILKEMKPNVRNIIHKTEKFGITVKEISYDELERFQSIMEETGARRNFAIRDLTYFQNMYKLFSKNNEIKYFITELNLKDYIERLNQEKKEKEEKVASLSSAKYNDNQKQSLINEITAIDKRIKEAEEIIERKKQDIITLSGSMFMLIKPEIIYLSSGNYEEFMKFNSQYLIQWELIKYGLKNGFKKHNFYGIPANINTHPKDYGIYEFKKGFNGYVEELIGEFELPISWHYKLIKLIRKLKK